MRVREWKYKTFETCCTVGNWITFALGVGYGVVRSHAYYDAFDKLLEIIKWASVGLLTGAVLMYLAFGLLLWRTAWEVDQEERRADSEG